VYVEYSGHLKQSVRVGSNTTVWAITGLSQASSVTRDFAVSAASSCRRMFLAVCNIRVSSGGVGKPELRLDSCKVFVRAPGVTLVV